MFRVTGIWQSHRPRTAFAYAVRSQPWACVNNGFAVAHRYWRFDTRPALPQDQFDSPNNLITSRRSRNQRVFLSLTPEWLDGELIHLTKEQMLWPRIL